MIESMVHGVGHTYHERTGTADTLRIALLQGVLTHFRQRHSPVPHAHAVQALLRRPISDQLSRPV